MSGILVILGLRLCLYVWQQSGKEDKLMPPIPLSSYYGCPRQQQGQAERNKEVEGITRGKNSVSTLNKT